MLIVCLASVTNNLRLTRMWMLVLLPEVNVPSVLDGVTLPGSVHPRSKLGKVAKDSKAKAHSKKGDLKAHLPRDTMLLEKDFKMVEKPDLGDRKVDPKDPSYAINVENPDIRRRIAELGLMRHLNNLFLLLGVFG